MVDLEWMVPLYPLRFISILELHTGHVFNPAHGIPRPLLLRAEKAIVWVMIKINTYRELKALA